MIGRRAAMGRLGASLLACTALTGAAPAGSVAFVTVARGARSGVRDAAQSVVRSADGWAALWARHAGASAAPPPVDFATEMIIAVFAGTRPTTGYDVEITRVVATDGGLRVSYRERRPPAGTIVSPVLTAPFHIIRLPRADGPVELSREPA
ncbi:MAG: protease complex subunit PrcB family protein [Candidatus Rokubacteria bacterium]|nr:protease complex subunit PrcB family protein [Candidatus Rokubacteria bacterium]